MRLHRITAIDSLFVLVASLVCLSIGLVSVQRHRELARATTCADNLKTIGLAFHNYHSTFQRLPMGCGGTFQKGADFDPERDNASRLSAFVGLTPFIEQQALWERISSPFQTGQKVFPPMGPVPWYDATVYKPWSMRPDVYACPSDPQAAKHTLVASYALNYGDAVQHVGHPVDLTDVQIVQEYRAVDRGAFSMRSLRFRDFLDGLSNTLFLSERKTDQQIARDAIDLDFNPSLAIAATKKADAVFWPEGREACWADGAMRSSGFQTILPPNSASATLDSNDLEGVISASSAHLDGVHVLFADGSVHFALDSIDSGDSTSPTVATPANDARQFVRPGSKSPYGLWGAIGTRHSAERLSNYDSSALVVPPREISEMERKELMKRPAQAWKARDGKRSITGRQIEVHHQAAVTLLMEDGEIKSVPLSSLDSADAYRAVEQHFAEQTAAQASLSKQIKEAIALLDEKQYEEFAAKFIVGGELDPKGMGRLVRRERGLLIYQLESSLRAIDSVPGAVEFQEDKMGGLRVEIEAQERPVFYDMKLHYSDGKWRYQPRM